MWPLPCIFDLESLLFRILQEVFFWKGKVAYYPTFFFLRRKNKQTKQKGMRSKTAFGSRNHLWGWRLKEPSPVIKYLDPHRVQASHHHHPRGLLSGSALPSRPASPTWLPAVSTVSLPGLVVLVLSRNHPLPGYKPSPSPDFERAPLAWASCCPPAFSCLPSRTHLHPGSPAALPLTFTCGLAHNYKAITSTIEACQTTKYWKDFPCHIKDPSSYRKSVSEYEDSRPPCQCLASAEVPMVQWSHAGPWVPVFYSDKRGCCEDVFFLHC